jgi:hypothetical protein
VFIYPLTTLEDQALRWTSRIVPTLAVFVILFLTSVCLASWEG